MAYDELELDRIGDRKTAVFFIISDTTQTYNFLVALAFSQMFNLLCERADNVHGGRLPHHVRVLWDEAANTGQVPQLEKIVAVIRSREISLTLFYQQLAQCKAIYDKHAETILGNMDSVIFLGGREASTIKEISENWLGKAKPYIGSSGAFSNRILGNRTGAGPEAVKCTYPRAWSPVRWVSSAPGPAAGYFDCSFPTGHGSGCRSAY